MVYELGLQSCGALAVQDQLLVLSQNNLLQLLQVLVNQGVFTSCALGGCCHWYLRSGHQRNLHTSGEEIEAWELERETGGRLEW